jgi:hypothetical protein
MDITNAGRSESVTDIIKALMEIQPQLHVIKNKTGQVGQQRYGYADLSAVWNACRDLLKEHGMVVTHSSRDTPAGDGITITATLYHQEGQWMSSSITMKPRSMSPQDMGSALTYGRRYTLASLVGIVVDDDDDGQAASKKGKPAPAPNSLDAKKARIRTLVKAYKGDDKEDIIAECAAMAENDGWTDKYADAIIAKLTK